MRQNCSHFVLVTFPKSLHTSANLLTLSTNYFCEDRNKLLLLFWLVPIHVGFFAICFLPYSCISYAGIVYLTYNNSPTPLLFLPSYISKHYISFQFQFSIGYILNCLPKIQLYPICECHYAINILIHTIELVHFTL